VTQRIASFEQPGLDLVVFDNNRLERLRFEDDLENAASTALCLESTRRFAELWRPDRFTVTTAALAFGGPADPQRPREIDGSIEGELAIEVPPGEMIAGIQTSVHGWNRVAIPDGADPGAPWQAVSADGLWPCSATVRAAPDLAGRATVWLRVDQVYSLGDAELRTMLGPSVFHPENDPRPADYQVRGRPLVDWQQANLAIYDHTIAALRSLGWR
jgi:hypothetical protein